MKKMKKVLSLVLAGVMALMLVACGSTDTAGGSDNGSANESGAEVNANVSNIKIGAVMLGDETEGYLRASEISAERVEDATTKLAVGDTVEALIISVDRKNRSIQLSIKAKDAAQTREALNRVNSDSSSGTTNLGALLKAKLEQK